MKRKNIKISPEGLNKIYEQMRLRIEMRRMGYVEISELAKELGVSRQTVYNRMKSEEKKLRKIRDNYLTGVK